MSIRESTLAKLRRQLAVLQSQLEKETDGRRRGSLNTQILHTHREIKKWTKIPSSR